MRGGSVRLTRAVRLAACGKEPEEKLSERRQQTADKTDVFIFSAETWEERGREQRQQKKPDWKRREERKTVWWAKTQATHPPMSVTLKGKTDEDWQKEVRNEKTTSDRGRDHSGEGGRRTNFHVSENKLRENGKGEKSEATWNRNGETTNLLSHLWIAPLYSAKGGATRRTEQTKQEEKRSGAGKKKEGNNKRRVENSDKRSKYLIKKQNDFLFPCNTACMKAVKVAQKKKKKKSSLPRGSWSIWAWSCLFFKFLKKRDSFVDGGFHVKAAVCDFCARRTAASGCHFLCCVEESNQAPNHGYNRLTRANPCSVTYCNACSICCRQMMSRQ